MNEVLIRRAAQILDPRGCPYKDDLFEGTEAEALDVMVAVAGVQPEWRLTRMLRESNPNRVAEVCAWALQRLAGGAA